MEHNSKIKTMINNILLAFTDIFLYKFIECVFKKRYEVILCMIKRLHPVLLLLIPFALFSSILLSGCLYQAPDTPVTRTGFAFDTVVTITIYDSKKEDVLDTCFALCQKYEELFSTTLEGSEVWNINHAAGNTVQVSYDTAVLIQAALSYCNESNGMLDLTLRPVSEEWDIAGQMKYASDIKDYSYYIPSAETLSDLLRHVDYSNVLLTDNHGKEIGYLDELSDKQNYYVTLKDKDCAIDLGFIAKGYIADCLKAYLLSEGIESGIISLGGNILLIGSKPDGSPFNVGIQKPFGMGNEVITTVQKSDTSVVSSGCYERYFCPDADKKTGIIYHHIFDTTTGYPVQNDLLGVTILSDSSLQGDALSTYCYILGLDKGLAYIRSLENVDAIFVTKNYEVITSY